MKLNPNAIEILIPQRLNMVASNKLSISSKTVSVSSSLVRKMNFPEYVRIYIDRKAKQLFIAPCNSDADGARRFYRETSKSKTVSFSSPALSRTIAEAAGLDLEKQRYRFECEEVEGRETTLGFDLCKS